MVGFRDFVGTDFAPVSNKTAVKVNFLWLLYISDRCSILQSVSAEASSGTLYLFSTVLLPRLSTNTFKVGKYHLRIKFGVYLQLI